MKISCVIMGHKWKGCKCERCGKQRDQEHDYRPCEGNCYKVCSICGRKKLLNSMITNGMAVNAASVGW